MYVRWADKEGYRGRVVDKCCCKNGGVKSATIEFEFEYAFGYLSGETGAHCLINFPNGSFPHEVKTTVSILAKVRGYPHFSSPGTKASTITFLITFYEFVFVL